MYAPGPFPLRQEPRDLRLQLAALSRAVSENRLDARLKIYTVPRLLIVDEICYLPIDRTSPRRLSPTNKYESGALSALFAIGQWRVAHFGHRDHSDRSIVISEIGGSWAQRN